MKQLGTHYLQLYDPFAKTAEWKRVQEDIAAAIKAVVWPPGTDQFVINPTKKGNGVVPIRKAFQAGLRDLEWRIEQNAVQSAGKVDAALTTPLGTFAVEWETGNISSSHRALNRLALGILNRDLVGGVLVLPSRTLYRYLTDRIGNLDELEKYFAIYRHLEMPPCVFAVVVVEHDAEDLEVPLIAKGTDGRALFRRERLEGS